MTKHPIQAKPDSDRPAFETEITEEMVEAALDAYYGHSEEEMRESNDAIRAMLRSALRAGIEAAQRRG